MAIHYDENLYKTWTMSPPLCPSTMNEVDLNDTSLLSGDMSGFTANTEEMGDLLEQKEYVGSFMTFMNLLNLMHGAGMLTISNSYIACGIWPTLAVYLFGALVCYLMGLMMFWLEPKLNTDSYGAMVAMTLGKWGTGLCHVSIAIFSYAPMSSYIIIAGKTVVDWVRMIGWDVPDGGWRYKLIVFLFAISIPIAFTLPRNLGFLSAFSTFSIVCLAAYVVVMCYEGGKRLPPIHETVVPARFGIGFLSSYSLYLMSFSLAAFILPVVSVSYPSTSLRIKLMSGAYLCCIIIVGVTGILGYFIFGDTAKDNILESFDMKDPVIIFVRVCFFFVISATYPVMAMSVQVMYGRVIFSQDNPNILPTWKRSIVLFLTNILPLVVGVFLPNIKPAMSIGGAFSGSITNFILPPLIWIRCSGRKLSHWSNIACIVIVIFGVISTVVCTYESVDEAIKTFKHK